MLPAPGGPVRPGRSLGVRARTLELVDRRGMAQALISRGHPNLRVVRHAPGRKSGEGRS
ncbi:MAG: hypothetical protein M3Y48_16340 [Actinomycetota bacterium]|nr:hypothetical protein [Actinomycetota bacterium]